MSDLQRDPGVVAIERGLDLVLPEPNEVFLDIDNDEDLKWYEATITEVDPPGFVPRNGEVLRLTETRRTRSQNGGWHITLEAEDCHLQPLERVCIQACLGSDRHREYLSFLRIFGHMQRPATTFFEVPK